MVARQPSTSTALAFAAGSSLALAAMVSACRPDVELGIPCGDAGDLSCPTGHHCGPWGACEPGEVAPVIVPTEGLRYETVAGVVSLEATIASPLGITGASVSLRSVAGDTRLRIEPTLDRPDDSETVALLRARIETWRLEDGPAVLTLEAWAAGDVPPGVSEVPLIIANGRPELELTTELPKSPFATVRSASLHVTSRIELRHLSATFGGRALKPVLSWSPDRREVAVDLLLDPAGLLPGETVLEVTAVDVANRAGVLERLLVVGGSESESGTGSESEPDPQ